MFLKIVYCSMVFWMMFVLHHKGFWKIQSGRQVSQPNGGDSRCLVYSFVLLILLEGKLSLDTYSEWYQAGIIEDFEKFKMVAKMAPKFGFIQ